MRVYRQFGPLLFTDITSTSGIPASLHDAQAVMMEDWNRDENMDVIASRKEGAAVAPGKTARRTAGSPRADQLGRRRRCVHRRFR